MSQKVKREFDVRPEYLKSQFLDHIRTKGLPETCPFITHEKPPVDGIEVILQDFVISRQVLEKFGYAPCPICSPVKPKYVKGHLLWSSESKALYAVGHCCGHGFFANDSLEKALSQNKRAEQRRHVEAFIEAHWTFPKDLMAYWENLKPAVRDLDKVLLAIRVGLRPAVCKDIHRTTRDGGFLHIQQKVGETGSDGPDGLKIVEQRFGTIPVRGATVLRGGNRGISVEARISNVVAALSNVEWQTENEALLWICDQVDNDLFHMADFIRDAVEHIAKAIGDIAALQIFMEPENLDLISAWSLAAHGRQGSVSISNEGGMVTMMRGTKQHRRFRVPTTLTQQLAPAPALRDDEEGGGSA
ncbi:hypothetical protein [Rhizobium sp. BK376]|uniref:hypothetical protein n=1 Tax=Rhizobium sp. BK376 TaxID=2512149 RepID=UPI00104B446B|nr:hypothetical protein [Rhizobium sp. BK376]TCR69597.1 hypothetical protein EV561_13923 [Rhizobium sp. BK376]